MALIAAINQGRSFPQSAPADGICAAAEMKGFGPSPRSSIINLQQPSAAAKGATSQMPARKSLLTSSLQQSSISVAQVFCVRTQRLCCGCDVYEGAAAVAVDGALMIVVKKLKPKLVG